MNQTIKSNESTHCLGYGYAFEVNIRTYDQYKFIMIWLLGNKTKKCVGNCNSIKPVTRK